MSDIEGKIAEMTNRTASQSLLLALALAFATADVALAAEPRAVTMMREHKCYTCHADDEALAGPAFADVASAYRGNRSAADIVATFIRSGAQGGGPWHMPPHPEISAGDARVIARHILSVHPHSRSVEAKSSGKSIQPHAATTPRS
jgi:cytochrome c